MANEFKPSVQSISPTDEVAAKLLYIRKALELVDGYFRETKDPAPPWVIDRLNQAAMSMGMAVSYVQYADRQKAAKDTAGDDVSTKARRKKP